MTEQRDQQPDILRQSAASIGEITLRQPPAPMRATHLNCTVNIAFSASIVVKGETEYITAPQQIAKTLTPNHALPTSSLSNLINKQPSPKTIHAPKTQIASMATNDPSNVATLKELFKLAQLKFPKLPVIKLMGLDAIPKTPFWDHVFSNDCQLDTSNNSQVIPIPILVSSDTQPVVISLWDLSFQMCWQQNLLLSVWIRHYSALGHMLDFPDRNKLGSSFTYWKQPCILWWQWLLKKNPEEHILIAFLTLFPIVPVLLVTTSYTEFAGILSHMKQFQKPSRRASPELQIPLTLMQTLTTDWRHYADVTDEEVAKLLMEYSSLACDWLCMVSTESTTHFNPQSTFAPYFDGMLL